MQSIFLLHYKWCLVKYLLMWITILCGKVTDSDDLLKPLSNTKIIVYIRMKYTYVVISINFHALVIHIKYIYIYMGIFGRYTAIFFVVYNMRIYHIFSFRKVSNLHILCAYYGTL